MRRNANNVLLINIITVLYQAIYCFIQEEYRPSATLIPASGLGANSTLMNRLQYPTLSGVRRQPIIPMSEPFPCATGPESRSSSRPTSVHRLRPGDIDVVAAMGDSLVAGNGALEEFALGAVIEYRGVSWCAGGQGEWREFLTLPNILKEFNPNLKGYSTGRGEYLSPNSHLNLAFPVSATVDAVQQAKLLVSRMKKDPGIDFENHWKMVTMMFGANDLCSLQCFSRLKNISEKHQINLKNALDYLYYNSPRTFVNLVPVIDVSISVRIERTPMCQFIHTLFCICFHQGGGEFNRITELVKEFQESTFQLVWSGRYDTKEDFTVVVQPFILFLNAPENGNFTHKEAIHISYITHDCFHFSQKGHALAANLLWNNLLEPVWNKSQQLPKQFLESFHCPSRNAPYFFTNENSWRFLKTGSQL